MGSIVFQCLFFLLTLFLGPFSLAISYDYKTLQMKNVDEMSNFVRKKIRKAEKVSAQAEAEGFDGNPGLVVLEETLFTVLSRPNADHMIDKIITPLTRELRAYNAYLKTFHRIVDASIKGLVDKSQSVKLRATYTFVLKNVMSEVQPNIKTDESIKAIYEKIYKAKIKIPKEVRSHLAKNMVPPLSLSEVAHSVLQKYFPKQYPPKKPWWKFW